MSFRFKQVDVFTGTPFAGNPVAVILDADDLDGGAMQRIANWTNLSETTFVLKPDQAGADYRVRIFTPLRELPFAGHPTLGTAHAVLDAGIAAPREGRLVQQCDVGLVNLSLSGSGRERVLTLELPPATVRDLEPGDLDELASALGAVPGRAPAPRVIDVGPRWLVTRLADAATVVGLRPDLSRVAALTRRVEATGVTVFGLYPPGGPAAIEVRSFAPSDGVNEDPVCGSGNGCVAVFARDGGLLDALGHRYVASQGCQVGRAGRVQVEIDGHGIVRLGGQCVTCVDGVLSA